MPPSRRYYFLLLLPSYENVLRLPSPSTVGGNEFPTVNRPMTWLESFDSHSQGERDHFRRGRKTIESIIHLVGRGEEMLEGTELSSALMM